MNQLILSLLLASRVFAQTDLDTWLSEFSTPPPGTNPAAFPMPGLDWFQRVKANNAEAKARAASVQLVFDGDSITDGWRDGGKAIWEERYAKFNAFNFGISGDRTENVLWRIRQGQLQGFHPKLVAIMIGTNNIGGAPENIAGGIREIVVAYQKSCPEAVILLQAIFPRREQPTDPARDWIKSVNALISNLADGKKVIFVDFSDKFLQADGTLSREVMPDFLHPGPKGYQIWADAIQPIINQYLGRSDRHLSPAEPRHSKASEISLDLVNPNIAPVFSTCVNLPADEVYKALGLAPGIPVQVTDETGRVLPLVAKGDLLQLYVGLVPKSRCRLKLQKSGSWSVSGGMITGTWDAAAQKGEIGNGLLNVRIENGGSVIFAADPSALSKEEKARTLLSNYRYEGWLDEKVRGRIPAAQAKGLGLREVNTLKAPVVSGSVDKRKDSVELIVEKRLPDWPEEVICREQITLKEAQPLVRHRLVFKY